MMKKNKFHFGSFLLGLLIGLIVLALLAVSLPPQSKAQTNNLLQKETGQVQASANQDAKKISAQVQNILSSFSRQFVQPVSRWFTLQWKNLVAAMHAQASPTCSVLTWLNQARAHFLALLGIQSKPLRLQGCAAV
jgi:gas vesicle protein